MIKLPIVILPVWKHTEYEAKEAQRDADQLIVDMLERKITALELQLEERLNGK